MAASLEELAHHAERAFTDAVDAVRTGKWSMAWAHGRHGVQMSKLAHIHDITDNDAPARPITQADRFAIQTWIDGHGGYSADVLQALRAAAADVERQMREGGGS